MKSARSASSTRTLSPEKTVAILDGAMAVFLEHGYVGTTMDRVAAIARVSKPTIYNHFHDKETLFNALVEQWVQKNQWATLPEEMLRSTSSVPAEQGLRQLAANMLHSCLDDPEKITFIRLVLGESGRFPALGQAFVQHMDKPMLVTLTHYLSSHPDVDLADPQAAAYSFAGTLIFFMMTHVMLHGADILQMDCDRLIDHLIESCKIRSR
jgi:TetR/AcrR family transcriptional regulator, regulator of autoinduction and epiphytic fitness